MFAKDRYESILWSLRTIRPLGHVLTTVAQLQYSSLPHIHKEPGLIYGAPPQHFTVTSSTRLRTMNASLADILSHLQSILIFQG